MVETNRPQSLERNTVRSVVAAINQTLVWFAGHSPEQIEAHRQKTRITIQTLGTIVLAWFLLMCGIWLNAGVAITGSKIAALGFTLVPIMLLGVDRLIISAPRNPDGALEAYHIATLKPNLTVRTLRVLIAFSFAGVTTTLYILGQSQGLIQAAQVKYTAQMNSKLKSDHLDRINSLHQTQRDSVTPLLDAAKINLKLAQEQKAAAIVERDELRSKAIAADIESKEELGGINGKTQGNGIRHQTYQSIAVAAAQASNLSQAKLERAIQAEERSQQDVLSYSQMHNQYAKARDGAIQGIDAVIAADPQAYKPATGLFADATTFIRLFSDGAAAPGLILWTVAAYLFLALIELLPILAAMLMRANPLDVDSIAQDRLDAARCITDTSISMAQATSKRNVQSEYLLKSIVPGGGSHGHASGNGYPKE